MSKREIARWSQQVVKEFQRICGAINDLYKMVCELHERLEELEEYVANKDDRPGG